MFKVFLKKSAEKFLLSLDKKKRNKILIILKLLEANPIPFKELDVKKLKGERYAFRIRAGKIRIVYHIVFESQRIIIDKIDYRESVYK